MAKKRSGKQDASPVESKEAQPRDDHEIVSAAGPDGETTLSMDDDDEGADSPPAVEPRGRIGASHQPACPQCSSPEEIVLCIADKTMQHFTYYRCKKKCGFRLKVPRPTIAQQQEQQRENGGFSAR